MIIKYGGGSGIEDQVETFSRKRTPVIYYLYPAKTLENFPVLADGQTKNGINGAVAGLPGSSDSAWHISSPAEKMKDSRPSLFPVVAGCPENKCRNIGKLYITSQFKKFILPGDSLSAVRRSRWANSGSLVFSRMLRPRIS